MFEADGGNKHAGNAAYFQPLINGIVNRVEMSNTWEDDSGSKSQMYSVGRRVAFLYTMSE